LLAKAKAIEELLAITTAQCQVALTLDQQIDMFLPLLDLFAHPVDLSKLCYVCLEKLDLAVFVQLRAFFNDSLCGRLGATDDVDAW